MKLSKALKSTLVTDAYDPGHIALMKRLRGSCAMITLSTRIAKVQFVGTNNASRKHFITASIAPGFADEIQQTIHALDFRS
jgi:hypothetical protein